MKPFYAKDLDSLSVITEGGKHCLSDKGAEELKGYSALHKEWLAGKHLINGEKFNKIEMVRFLEAMLQCEKFWGMQSKKTIYTGLGLQGAICRNNEGLCADIRYEADDGEMVSLKQLIEDANVVGLYVENECVGFCCLVDARRARMGSKLEECFLKNLNVLKKLKLKQE